MDPGDIRRAASKFITDRGNPAITTHGIDNLNVQTGTNAKIIGTLFYLRKEKGKLTKKNFQSNFTDEQLSALYDTLSGGSQQTLGPEGRGKLEYVLFRYATTLGILN